MLNEFLVLFLLLEIISNRINKNKNMVSVKVAGVVFEFGNDDSSFPTTTVANLIDKINLNNELKIQLQSGRLKFGDFVLEADRSLRFYGIKHGDEIEIEKHYDPFKHFEIKFTDAPDAIMGDTNGKLRALLSCGHAVDPNSLTAYCRSLIDGGNYKIVCPALVNGSKRCNKKLEYSEIRKLALLNESEASHFEKKISELAAAEYVDFKECPNCRSFIEREDLTNLRVICNICKSLKGKIYEFCWQCEKEWTVPISKAADTCGRENCENQDLLTLRQAIYVSLDQVADLKPVPSIRACPTCGKLSEHNRTACKNVICPRCKIEFCFVCLETTAVCKKSSSAFRSCSKPIAAIQTKIPVWKRN